MNTFSILAVLSSLFIAAAGIVMLYISNRLGEDSLYYVDNLLGIGGVAMIVLAAAIIPFVVYMRRCVRIANQVKASQEIYPVVGFLREQQKLWRYASIVMIIAVVVGVVAVVAGSIYYFSQRSM
ncbi:MAG: hypothetical protein IKN11_06090 [Bacteroidales bacterium]|nr:hypothetical protein [Bacteroidales bacterium]